MKTAQQSVYLTGGILRHFRHFSTPEQNPAPGFLSTPAHPQVTPTVGWQNENGNNIEKQNYYLFIVTNPIVRLLVVSLCWGNIVRSTRIAGISISGYFHEYSHKNINPKANEYFDGYSESKPYYNSDSKLYTYYYPNYYTLTDSPRWRIGII
jgi:hypothetical protein